MNTSPNPARSQPQLGSTFRRNPGSWTLFRAVLGLGGATLVLFPVASGNSYILSVAGLVMFVTAILLLPAKPRITFEEKARELGALLVVDGGRYHSVGSSSEAVQLFVAADKISALDSKFHVVLEIPVAEITSFLALQGEKEWFLEVLWTSHAAEFSYRGASAERLAHIAENAIRRVAPPPAPEVPQRRAASA